MASMASRKAKTEPDPYRDQWPRVRTVSVRGVEFHQVDGRPSFKRKTFSLLSKAQKQADDWRNTRQRFGTAGRYISQKDASKFAEALDLLAPHGADIIKAAQFYAAHLTAEKARAAGKLAPVALQAWADSYNTKDRGDRTRREIKSLSGIFSRAFDKLKLGEMTAAMLKSWIEGYESEPGKLASPQTRANLRTKLSQFLNYCKMEGWIEKNPLEDVKVERPPRAPVVIFDLKQVVRIIEAADKSPSRDIVLPYAAICLFAGLRPGSEAEKLRWQDINFGTGDVHVRAETSKTREERFVPMEANLSAWLETCPVRAPGPIIGKSYTKFRDAWEEVKRVAGYKVGEAPEDGWPALAQDWPADATRHTYASMWLAVHKSRAELAEHMGNSETTIKSHYRRAIREDVAKAFWAMKPKAKTGGKIVHIDSAA
jgi:integrase